MWAVSAYCYTTGPVILQRGLSVSAPIDRRKDAWIEDLQAAGRAISAQLGYEN